MESKSIRQSYLLQIATAILGVLLCLYMLVHHTRLMTGIQEGKSFCSFGKYADCDVVNSSRFSELFGVPLASFGTVYFFLVAALSLLASPKDRTFRLMQGVLGWLLCFGLLFDLVYFVIQLAALKTLCIMCCLSYVVNIAAFFFAVRATGSTSPFFAQAGYLIRPNEDWHQPKLNSARFAVTTVGLILIIALVMLIPSYIRQDSPTYEHVNDALDQAYAAWKDKPIRKLEVLEGDGKWGNPDSKVQVVEFSDFQCPFCRRAAFTLHTVLKPYKDRIFFVFKNFPLDTSCNPRLQYQLHAHACKMAKLGACAVRKDEFWQFHDLVFLSWTDDKFKEGFDSLADGLKSLFSNEEIKQCLESSFAADTIAGDLKLGNELGISGTPTLFINGKQVTIPITVESIRKLIELEESIAK